MSSRAWSVCQPTTANCLCEDVRSTGLLEIHSNLPSLGSGVSQAGMVVGEGVWLQGRVGLCLAFLLSL